MIVALKESKLDKVNKSLFRIISVTASDERQDGVYPMYALLPPARLMLDRKNGEIGKKKFAKKYKKFLSSNNSVVENTIFSIALSLSAKNSIVFTCTDDEYKLGYLDVLVDYICERFEIDKDDPKEFKSRVNDIMDELDLSKKEKKLINGDISDDDLSSKKADQREKLIKRINKALRSTMGYEGEEYMKSLDKKYAIDQMALKVISNGIATLNKNGEFKDINTDNLKKTTPIVQAILTTYESDKDLKKVIKKVFESHDLKVKEKTLKKLDKASIVGLLGELYTNLTIFRSEFSEDD